jgi:hypothetical protein
MAAPKKPGNPWNQFPKKKAPGKLSTRTPKPTVNPSRAVGAGGPPAAPPNRSGTGGGGNRRGGSIVKASGNGGTSNAQVKPVNVRDVTGQPRGQVSGATAKGSLSTAKPPAKLPGGPRMPALSKGAASTATNVGKTAGKGLLAKAAVPVDIALTANSIFNPNSEGNQQLAKAASAVNKRFSSNYGPRFNNPGSGASSAKGAKPKSPMPKGSGDALREKSYASLQKFKVPATKAPAATKQPSVARSTSPARSSGGTPMRSSVRSSSSSKPATPEVKQSKDMNENYRIWAAKYGDLAAKVKKGQAGYNAISKDAVAGMGPVRDSASYKPSVSSSDTASTDKKDSLKIASSDKKKKK